MTLPMHALLFAAWRRPAIHAGWALVLVLVWVAAAQAQLRVVSYNTTGPPDPGMDIVLRSIGEELRNGFAKPIDVLLLQEQTTTAGLPDAQAFVNLLNGMYAGQTSLGLPISYARGNIVGFGDTTHSIVYRTQTVDLAGETSVGTSGGANPQPRATIRHQLRFDGYTAADATLYVYNSHFKAGDEANDPANLLRRNTEANAIRTNSNALGNAHAIYAGDLNVYTAGEPAFQTLLAAGAGQGVDPLGLTAFDSDLGTTLNGEWHNNSTSVSNSHTQSPCAAATAGCGVGGGMDDRFDFQLMTGELLDGEGLDTIANSYHAFGNGGGFCCNNSINVGSNLVAFPGVTSHTRTQILNALATVTDHIPVVVDYQLPAVMQAVAGAVPATLDVGQVFGLGVTVANAANVLAALGADELDYSAVSSGDVSGSFLNQVDAALGGANAHLFAFDTSTPGMKSGTITITGLSQQMQNGIITIPISYEVLSAALAGDYNGNGVVDAADYVAWRETLGQSVAGADGNGNGLVDDGDYGVWRANFGNSAGGGGASLAGVPEPGAAVMLLLGVCLAQLSRVTLKRWTGKS